MKAEIEERPASRADMVFTVRLPASGRNGQKKPISQSGSFGVDGRDGVDAHHVNRDHDLLTLWTFGGVQRRCRTAISIFLWTEQLGSDSVWGMGSKDVGQP